MSITDRLPIVAHLFFAIYPPIVKQVTRGVWLASLTVFYLLCYCQKRTFQKVMLCEKREEVMPLSASKCISCGASNPAEAKFCPACGYPMRYNNHNRQSAPIGSIATPYVLNQRFRVMAKVGQGGFGAVYKAEDIHLENVARAIKEMNQESQSP